MSEILEKILRGERSAVVTPAEMGRAMQPTQYAHQIPVRPRLPLAERGAQTAGINPEARALAPSEEQMGPQTRHHIEHLERQMKMAEMRLKETRQQLAEMTARVGEAGAALAQMELRYEEIDSLDVYYWLENEVFPRLREVLGMPADEKGGAF